MAGGNSEVSAGGFYDTDLTGNNDIANVFDPFGPLGSSADSGAGFVGGSMLVPGDFDLASVFGDGFNGATGAQASGGSFLIDILPSLFGEASSGAAVNAGNFLTDILGGFSF